MTRFVAIALSTLVVGASLGCEDPAAGKPKAEVGPAAAASPGPSAAASAAAAPAPVAGAQYAFSQDGSTVNFVGAKVTGKHDGGFKDFQGTIASDGKEITALQVTLNADSLWSDNEKLTGHLKSPDFFDVAKFPSVTFKSTQIVADGAGGVRVTGDLNLHGVTKAITFPAKVVVDAQMVVLTSEFALNRKDFGIVYPGKPDDLIRDDVLLNLAVAAKKS